MREFFEIILDSVFIFGYDVPTLALMAGTLIAVSIFYRYTWPGYLGGLLLFVIYFLPRP